MEQFGMGWALAAIKQAASLSCGTVIFWTDSSVYFWCLLILEVYDC